MDVITSIQSCLTNWGNGGESECRTILISPHCHPSDPECVDVLTSIYQTLLHSSLSTWPSRHTLSPSALVAFVQTVLAGLPSSSVSSKKSINSVLFGELLVDLIWAVDSELDEVLADAKSTIIAAEHDVSQAGTQVQDEKDGGSKELLDALSKSVQAKENAERDKDVLADIIRKFLRADILEPSPCRERLDMNLLMMVGLIPDKATFEKKEIRTRTGLFYKQNKFNLLREQSEGYTKLTTDLVGSLGPPHSASTGFPSEDAAATEGRAHSAWERVVSLIGYFDLDPNRALDIILDVFSVNLASHHQFFLSLLSFSPWAGESQKLRFSAKTKGMAIDPDLAQYRGKELDEILIMAEFGSNQNQSSPGPTKKKPRVLAQVLGFKFSHYQSSEVHEVCPRSLYLAAALLIREYFITLEDLYPHLGPFDEEMPKFRQKYLDDVQSRINVSADNLLAMAAPLESSSSGTSSKARGSANADVKKVIEIKEVQNQKAMLLTALLSIGALRPAIAILSKFPWLVDAHREIADLLLRVVKTSLAPLYDSMFNKERNTSFLQPRSRYGTGGVVVPPPRKAQLTLCAPTPPSTHILDFVFFFPQWLERVPMCSNAEDLVDVIEPLMGFIGLHVSREPLFLTKFLRIGKIHLSAAIPSDPETNKPVIISEPDNNTQQFWLKVARKYLLPAMSLITGNAVCTVEVWNILKQYETTVRWKLYGEWRDVTYKSHPELKVQQILRERETKGVLRRLSSQTVESLSGAVAKLAHSNPCIFFTNAVHQIQAYDNLTDVVIQALRYATNMGFDILVFIILDALANPQKERVKDDGVYASDWLQSLATFTGALFRRYSSDLTPLLKYIVHQLYCGQTSEIIVLEKLTLKMAGIEPLPSLSDAQIAAMAGGPTLRIESVASDIRGAGFDVSDAGLRGAQRLGRALIDSRLAFPLLIQVAQQRHACVFKTKDAHLKSIAFLFDATHGVLFQYLDLLTTSSAVSMDDYRSIIPPLSQLCSLYGISAPIAMQIIRPMLNEAIANHALAWTTKKAAAKTESAEAAEKRLKAALSAKREPASSGLPTIEGNLGAPSTTLETPAASQAPSSDADGMEGILPSQVTNGCDGVPVVEAPWIPELSALFDECKAIAPGNAYDVVGPGFYLSFWQLSSYDIYFPKDRYEEADKILHASSEASHAKYRHAERSLDKSIRQTSLTHRNQRERYLNTAVDLKKEKSIQESLYRFTTDEGGRLDCEKLHWFSHVVGLGKVTTFVSSLIEHCIQPRCLLSPMDADFCARIIKAMHIRGTPGFPSLMCYDKLLGDHVKVVIFSCSENEARNYGRFLRGILHDLYLWHKDEKAFDESNRHKDGTQVTVLPGFQKRWSNDAHVSPEDLIKWSDFKSFLKKCHRKLGRCFTDCIEAGDFMHVYNAVLVLKEIIDVFPMAAVNEVVGSSIDLEIQRLTQSEERGDLKILARAYSSSLKKREAIWAMPKVSQPIVKPNPSTPTAGISKSSTPIPQPPSHDHPRETTTSASTTQLTDRSNATVPSGPRASNVDKASSASVTERPVTTRIALESIPRPEVVKRVRPETKSVESSDTNAEKKEEGHLGVSIPADQSAERRPVVPTGPAVRSKEGTPISSQNNSNRLPPGNESNDLVGLRKDTLQSINGHSRPPTAAQMQVQSKDYPHSPRPRSFDDTSRPDSSLTMPPPMAPSQTQSAHDLRTTAKQTTSQAGRPYNDSRALSGASDAIGSPPIRRSPSPLSRPGTRNASVESRTSVPGEKSRSDRGVENDGPEDKRMNRDSQSRPERGDRGSTGHREAIHGRSERNGRDRIPGRDGPRDNDRDKDTDRDRERTRDRDKDRDRDRDRERERDRDKTRDRDRDRERDRERDRDRHRREEKERDRDQRKERETPSRASLSSSSRDPGAVGEHGLPTRPDPSRHRSLAHTSSVDETLGKRRRPLEDDPERGSKRGSRREGHREERTRRSSDKDSRDHPRDPDRRRKDREGLEIDTNLPPLDMPSERTSRLSENNISSAKASVPPPSAPRAMASAPSPRLGRSEFIPNRDRDWKVQRDSVLHINGSDLNLQSPPASLRARIGDKEASYAHSPSSPSATQRPSILHGLERRNDTSSLKDNVAFEAKKRTLSDRDGEKDTGTVQPESAIQAPKRPRILRNRYGDSTAGFARRVLPIEPQDSEKGDRQPGRI